MYRIFSASAALVIASGAAFANTASSAPPYAWVQMTDNNQAIVRVITKKTCSEISDATLQFSPRTAPKDAQIVAMPGNLCELTYALAPSPQQITVDNVPLTLPGTQAPERILVLGDTGCREQPAGHQNCDTDWFFKDIAEASAKLKPDLIVHVGDYTYRENCWNGDEGCGTDNEALRDWPIWEQDFFGPAQGLLAAAPWVFVRGNHEDCAPGDERGWVGWTQFFSPQKMDGGNVCNVPEASMMQHISFSGGNARDLNMYLMNANVAKYTDQDDFSSLDAGVENWLLTHVPFWSKNGGGQNSPFPGDWPNADMVVSGHVHLFALRQEFKKNDRSAPLQVIQGGSGVNLERSGPPNGIPFFYSYDRDFSVTMIERDASADTVMTLCRLSRSQGLKAHQSWKITRNGATGVTVADMSTDTTACAP